MARIFDDPVRVLKLLAEDAFVKCGFVHPAERFGFAGQLGEGPFERAYRAGAFVELGLFAPGQVIGQEVRTGLAENPFLRCRPR